VDQEVAYHPSYLAVDVVAVAVVAACQEVSFQTVAVEAVAGWIQQRREVPSHQQA
jgi:hypothetical protein